MEMRDGICEWCGKSFSYYAKSVHRGRFCGDECVRKWMRSLKKEPVKSNGGGPGRPRTRFLMTSVCKSCGAGIEDLKPRRMCSACLEKVERRFPIDISREDLCGMREGKTWKQVAIEIGVSDKTLLHHRRRLGVVS